ncbi:alpha/beta fold hydrolase [Altererythrobacter aestiaquae]|uniref:Alpha/beta fold hydrolase n=2 Tax=Pontixanthobacter aestiaquae TaxID=1509367 RepID=A0A844Z8C6_9SPHN|nr:alpha/beta fold hydrolase [Pontixanthobacter aestiaquae]
MFTAWCTPAFSQESMNDDELFGARLSVLDVSISPDGSKLAIIAPGGKSEEIVYVINIETAGQPKAVLRNNDPLGELIWCNWATNDRVICQLRTVERDQGRLLSFSRLIVVDDDGANAGMLTQPKGANALSIIQDGGSVISWDVDGEDDTILMTREFVPESSNGTQIYSNQEGLGVDAVNVKTLKRRRAEKPRNVAARYIADDSGRVRLMAVRTFKDGYLRGDTTYLYRDAGKDDWNPFEIAEDMVPVAVDSRTNRAFAFGTKDGFASLYSISLDGNETIDLLVHRDNADVDSLLRIGRKNRVVGASYATDRRQIAFFDEELKGLAASLQKALPGNPLIEFVDSSEDESKLLIIASRDVDPGMVYLFDKNTKRLEELLPLRNGMADIEMGTMRTVSYPAADGTEIPAYLTLPPRSDGRDLPALVMPHGGPSARDEWGFDWLAQYFARQGYAVLQPNYRGSAGYGSDWYMRNGFQSWRIAVGDVADAGRWLVNQNIADADKLAIVGWSYGGYAALQSDVVAPGLFKAVVAIAPVTDLGMLKSEAEGFTNFRLVEKFVGSGPHVSAGSPARNADSIVSPVLLFHGEYDENVSVNHSRLMVDALKDVGKSANYVEYKGLDHYLDDSETRRSMLKTTTTFLTEHLGED